MKKIITTNAADELCRKLEAGVTGGREIVLDFKGVLEVESNVAEKIMTTCLKLKDKGDIIRLKDMSLTLRNQFLLSAIDYAGDEILL
jgi:hypothetical protein